MLKTRKIACTHKKKTSKMGMREKNSSKPTVPPLMLSQFNSHFIP